MFLNKNKGSKIVPLESILDSCEVLPSQPYNFCLQKQQYSAITVRKLRNELAARALGVPYDTW